MSLYLKYFSSSSEVKLQSVTLRTETVSHLNSLAMDTSINICTFRVVSKKTVTQTVSKTDAWGTSSEIKLFKGENFK